MMREDKFTKNTILPIPTRYHRFDDACVEMENEWLMNIRLRSNRSDTTVRWCVYRLTTEQNLEHSLSRRQAASPSASSSLRNVATLARAASAEALTIPRLCRPDCTLSRPCAVKRLGRPRGTQSIAVPLDAAVSGNETPLNRAQQLSDGLILQKRMLSLQNFDR